MSILHSNDNGWVISHLDFFDNITVTGGGPDFETQQEGELHLTLNPHLFDISEPFKDKINGKLVKDCEKIQLGDTAKSVKVLYQAFLRDLRYQEIFNLGNQKVPEEDENGDCNSDIISKSMNDSPWPKNNFKAVHACQQFFDTVKTLELPHFRGENPSLDKTVLSKVTSGSETGVKNDGDNSSTHQYLFPPDTRFYCNDVANMEQIFQDNGETGFDLIVVDPPWWNKFIRRRKRKQHEAGYEMIDNDGIAKLPIQKYLNDGGVIVVWCTNAKSHQDTLINKMFPKWGITYQTNLHWLKVTKAGMPVCPFNAETKKQPFETIIVGIKKTLVCPQESLTKPLCSPEFPSRNDFKIVISVPSSINSHKPPLINVVKQMYPEKVFHRKLEIFARYLTSGFVSYGNEVVKLQHMSLFKAAAY